MNLDYPLASNSWDEKEVKAATSLLESKKLTMGEFVNKYEENFASFFGSKYAVMTSSGSSANLLLISSLMHHSKKNIRLNHGDEIIVPAVSWSTTFFPISQNHLKLVFVDIDKETLNIDSDKVLNAITKKTKAIFAVNLLGNPADLDLLKSICKERDIYLIEDNCESMGAKLNDIYTGSYGFAGTYSSFFSHHISTMEGGCVVTDDRELYEIMLSMRAHGWTRNLPEDSIIYKREKNDFYESFNFILPGYNLRPLELSGVIGIEQLIKFPKFLSMRRKNAMVYKNCSDMLIKNKIRIQKENGSSSYFGFAFMTESKDHRNYLIEKLKLAGVETRPIVSGNFTLNPVIKKLNHRVQGRLENANIVHNSGFFIGNHHYDVRDKLERVIDFICKR